MTVQLHLGDCLEFMRSLPAGSVDAVITDPPYGFRKADWDTQFPVEWIGEAARVARRAIAVMPGINNIMRLPQEVGDFEYRWSLSVTLSNGMTRGLMGFGNWIPVIVYARKGQSLYRAQQDATSVAVSGDMPDHPSPKPIKAMEWIVARFDADTIFDPFMGSGTTGVAAVKLGRNFIGCEIEPKYYEIAQRRIADAQAQLCLPLDMVTA